MLTKQAYCRKISAHNPFSAKFKPNKLTFAVCGSLIFFTTPIFAADLSFEGITNAHGNPDGLDNLLNEYSSINITVNGVDSNYYPDTTEALVISDKKSFTATESVKIINTAQNDKIDNNGALYAKGDSTINFNNLSSIYIAAVGGSEALNDSTAISAKTSSLNSQNTVTISGNNVQIIGSLDVTPTATTDNNEINLTLEEKDSFWYGSALGEIKLGNIATAVNLTLKDGASWIFNASSSLLNNVFNSDYDVSKVISIAFGGNKLSDLKEAIKSGNKESIKQKMTALGINETDAEELLNILYNENKTGKLSNLTLNGGVVILDDELISQLYDQTYIGNKNLSSYRSEYGTNHSAVIIENLKGSGGTFKMDIDWLSNQGTIAETDASDFIYITNVADEGSKQYIDFDISKANLNLMNAGDKLYFAQVENGDTTFTSAADNYIQNSADEVRLYSYSTQNELSNNYTLWYLTKYLGNTNEYVPFIKGAAFASYSLATDMDRFNKRRGESRYVSGENDGLWVRYAYTDLSWDNAFDMDKHMIQLGYDHKLAAAHGSHYLGASFDYTQANIDIDGLSGDSDSERYALNLYYTYIADSGLYADFVLKGGVIDSDYDIKNSNGTDIGSDIDQTFYGISAESGYKFNFANSLFFEPQAQLQFIHLDGDTFTSKGGVNAKIHDLDSIIGRIGFSAGYEFSSDQNTPCGNIYIKADILHEFDGDKEIDMLGRTTSYSDKFSGKETWYDIGVGTDFAAAKNTKIYFEAEHIFGADFENTWQINAGARYEF